MAQHEKKRVFARFREVIPQKNQRLSQKTLLNLNSCNSSYNSSLLNEANTSRYDANKNKFFHALSARKLHNGPQFSLAQLNTTANVRIEEANQPKIGIRNKIESENQILIENQGEASGINKGGKSARFTVKQDVTKCTNKTLSILLDMSNKKVEKNNKCKECQRYLRAKQHEKELIAEQLKHWQNKFHQSQQKYQQLKKKFAPYINNVALLSVVVDSLHDKEKDAVYGEIKQQQDKLANQQLHSEIEETSKVNKWLLKQGREKDKIYHAQTFRLNCQIDLLRSDNQRLKNLLGTRQNKVKGLEQQLKYYQSNNSVRERLEMCRQELYAFKLKYQQKRIQNEQLNKRVEQMKYKLTVLTSLIGCAIIFDLKQKQNDKRSIKQFINKIDKYETITHNILQNNGFQYLKFYQNTKNQSQNLRNSVRMGRTSDQPSVISKTLHYRKLYLPNYLSLLGEQSLAARGQHMVIKPTLFIKMRSIMDSKYIDYRLFEAKSSSFPDFCNSHLRNYDILQSEKKPYLLIRQISQNEVKEVNMNFFQCLLDQRIQDLPQVEIFRQFLMNRWEQDQIYFYLMCRHKFLQGNQLQNFINSGDPSKFIKFDKAKRLSLKLTEGFGRSIQNFLCYHLSEKKIIKYGQQFIRIYYLLKILILLYRKVRLKKIQQFRQCFESVLHAAMHNTLSFLQFNELLRKNFEFLSRSEVCNMYRTACALYQSQKNQGNFYECFVALCFPGIFLKQLIHLDKQLEIDCIASQQILGFAQQSKKLKRSSNTFKFPSQAERISSCSESTQKNIHTSHFKPNNKINQLNELWPESVYILGNQILNREYVQLLKDPNHQDPRVKLEILAFLNNLVLGHSIKQNIHLRAKEDLSKILATANSALIQYLNLIEKEKIEYENDVNLASKKIGRFFKNKVYQFYHEMLQDINGIKSNPTNSIETTKNAQSQTQKSKRYFKQKIRASKIFTSFKLS